MLEANDEVDVRLCSGRDRGRFFSADVEPHDLRARRGARLAHEFGSSSAPGGREWQAAVHCFPVRPLTGVLDLGWAGCSGRPRTPKTARTICLRPRDVDEWPQPAPV